MYGRKNDEILKQVDSFIAQAKLEGDISGSSSSNLSLITKEKDDVILEQPSVNNYQFQTNHHKCSEEDTSKCERILLNNKTQKNGNVKAESNIKEKDSCDSSYIDLGNERSRSSIPYVMWLQEKRSKRNLQCKSNEDFQSKKKYNQRDEVHIREVNSALFWERWIDKIFDIYDQWVQSSDSEDCNAETEETQLKKEYPNRNLPTRIKSEPILRGRLNEVVNLKYKCPSYVDWLVRRRQEKMESSESEEVLEETKNDNYWSSLYGKLTKSLSSLFLSPTIIKDGNELEDKQAEATLLVKKSQSGSSSDSVKASSKFLRRSHSTSCSYRRYSGNSTNRVRHRQLNQDAVGSPVLTDQLVELVCNTLSPDSSEDSSSQDDCRKCKLNRRNAMRRS